MIKLISKVKYDIIILLLSASAKKDRNFVCGVLKPSALSLVTKHTAMRAPHSQRLGSTQGTSAAPETRHPRIQRS